MNKWFAIFAALVLTVGLTACSGGGEESSDTEQAVEEAGEAMGDAVDAVGDAAEEVAEDAADAAEDVADDAADAADDAAEDLEAAADDAHEHGADAVDSAIAAVDGAVDTAMTELAKLTGEETTEVGCGMCMYSMEGVESCELAAKVDGKAYLVTGVDFDTHGSGLCNGTSNAKITGSVYEDGVTATKVELTD